MSRKLILIVGVFFATFYPSYATKAFDKDISEVSTLERISPKTMPGKPAAPLMEKVLPVSLAGKRMYYAPLERTFDGLTLDETTLQSDVLQVSMRSDASDAVDSIQYHINKAEALFQEVTTNNYFVSLINPQTLTEFPVGIKKTIGNMDYTIVIEEVVLTPVGAYFTAYMRLQVPESEQVLTFMAREVQFTKRGGLTGEARLELLQDIEFKLSERSLMRIIGGDGEKTFVTMDCYGFKNMGLASEVEFSRDWVVPENADGSIGEGRVKGTFETVVSSWQDLVVEVSLSPFRLTQQSGFSFAVSHAVLDLSDTHNHPAINFPHDYESPYFLEGNRNLWRGFYLQEAVVKLPKEFNKADNPQKRITITASNLLIDDLGFTGAVSGTNLILMKDGNMDGWKYSLDSIGVSFKYGELASAGFNGEVIVPVGEDDRPQLFAYDGLFLENGYQMVVETLDTLNFSMWSAQATLRPESYIEVNVINGKFKPKAMLHGSMDISGENDLQLLGVEFEKLQIQTDAPYLQAEYFSFGSEALEQKFADFPVQISEVGLVSDEDLTGIRFRTIVNFVPDDDMGFGGEAELTVWGKINDGADGLHKYEFESVEVSEIIVDVQKEGSFSIYGKITFFRNDPVYGKGFNGMVDATFGMIQVQASAIFGNVDGMRYWYADGLYASDYGIPVMAGLSIYGFGGGAYYHMTRSSGDAGSKLGQTLSGVIYTPDAGTRLGLKASVVLGAQGNRETYNGDATFEIAFSSRGGVSKIAFDGNAYFITEDLGIDVSMIQESAIAEVAGAEIPMKQDAQISGHISLLYDNENKVFHGDLNVYVDVAGGLIKGVGANKEAGWAVLHFEEEEWYVYIGTPDRPIGLEMVGLFRTESYMMMGDNIPEIPNPPSQVTELIRGGALAQIAANRDEQALMKGSGFAFGSKLQVSTGEKKFLIFYGKFDAGVGMDIMLKDYGDNARCSGSMKPLGINGWYAKGQAYAYLSGSIGIKVKILGKSGKYEIFSGGAATLMRAEGPNPFFMIGTVGGRYRILGGLVKGSFEFEVTIGDQCKVVGDPPVPDIKVIADITPKSSTREVSVFAAPQAVFNLSIGEPFEMKDNEGRLRKFRIALDDFHVEDPAGKINGDIEWNADANVAVFKPYDIMGSEKDVKVSVSITFEEYLANRWKPVLQDGRAYKEMGVVTFKTGKAPDHVPHNNITYSYPVISQRYFLKKESSRGYIQLRQGQDYLFEQENDWEQFVLFEAASGAVNKVNFNYNKSSNRLEFAIPSTLQNNAIYDFKVVKMPVTQLKDLDQNVSDVTASIDVDNPNVETTVTTKKAEGSLKDLKQQQLFGSHFKTSIYNTLAEKISAYTIHKNNYLTLLNTPIQQISMIMEGAEDFDDFEVRGTSEIEPMVQFEAIVTNNTYFNSDVNPLVYQNYPYDGLTIDWRNPTQLGVIPVKAIFIEKNDVDRLTAGEIQSGSALDDSGIVWFTYDFMHVMKRDFGNLRFQAASKLSRGLSISSRANRLLETEFPGLRIGDYRAKVHYVLPGTSTPNSSKDILFKKSY